MKSFIVLLSVAGISFSMLSAQVRWLSPTLFGTGDLRSAAASQSSIVVCGAGQMFFSVAGEQFKQAEMPYREFEMNDVTLVWDKIFIAVGESGVILRSTNNGASWTQTAKFSSSLNSCATIVGNGVIMAVGRNGLVVRSGDAGGTWAELPQFTSEDLYSISETGLSVLITGAGGLTAISSNGGGWWSVVERAVDDDIHASIVLSPQNYFIGGTSGTIYATSDGGASWNKSFIDTNFAFQHIRFVSSQIGYALGAAGRIVRTTDGGATWNIINFGNTGFLFDAFGTGNNAGLIGEAGAILYSTDNGNSWTPAIPPTNSILYSIRYDNAKSLWAVGEQGTIINFSNGLGHSITSPAAEAITVLSADNQIVIATKNGAIFTSINKGASWNKADSAGKAIGGISKFAEEVYIAVGKDGLILRSSDNGTTWSRITAPIIKSFTACATNGNGIGIIVGDSGAILRTTDAGLTWNYSLHGNVVLLSASFSDENHCIAAGDHGTLLRTSDAGLTWQKANSPDSTVAWTSLSFDRTTQGGILISLEGDIYATFNGGETWQSRAKTGALCLSADFRDNTAAICGGGGAVITIDGIVSVRENKQSASFLAELHPMPVKNIFELSLCSPSFQNIRVSVISLEGSEIFSQHAEMPVGNSSLQLDIGQMTSGIYHCRIASPLESVVLPLIIVK